MHPCRPQLLVAVRVVFCRITSCLALSLIAIVASAGDRPVSIDDIAWQHGPTEGQLGEVATIAVPEGMLFADDEGTRRFLELTENIPSGEELGMVLHLSEDPERVWFVTFQFAQVGYIKDDERSEFDAAEMLGQIKRSTDQANEERRRRGWGTIDVVGWQTPPFYDSATNNLTWSLLGRSADGDVINYNTRLLGRKGYVSANLVLSPSAQGQTLPAFRKLLNGYSFQPGNRYAEFRRGDKVAAYGLSALIVGGAAATAAKSGLLSKLWKLLVAGVVAAVAGIRSLFARLTGRSQR